MVKIMRKPLSFQVQVRIGTNTKTKTFYAHDNPTPEGILEIIEKHLLKDHLVE